MTFVPAGKLEPEVSVAALREYPQMSLPAEMDAEDELDVLNSLKLANPIDVFVEGTVEFLEFSKSDPRPREAHTFYASHEGLGVAPLLPYPVELMANARSFALVRGSLQTRHRLFACAQWTKDEHADCSWLALQAINAELTAKHAISLLKDKSSEAVRYFRNLQVLKFVRACWDALMLAYQQISDETSFLERRRLAPIWVPNADTRRAINRFRHYLLMEPLAAAKLLKQLAGEGRAWYFSAGPKPAHPLLRQFTTTKMGLVFSYVGRALPPPPPSTIKSSVEDLVTRLTSRPLKEAPGWRGFCSRYLSMTAPKLAPEDRNYHTDHSVGGSLGYRRIDGGFHRAIEDILDLGFSLQYQAALAEAGGKLPPSLVFQDPRQRAPEPSSLAQLQNQADGYGTSYQNALQIGVSYIMDRVEILPVQALAADERGLKVRNPTKGLAAANLIHQLFRRAADMHFVQDQRSSRGMGGTLDVDLTEHEGPWYSQDLSAATDLHDFWLERVFYEELLTYHPVLKKYEVYMPKLFGSKKLVTGKVPDPPSRPFETIPEIGGHGRWSRVLLGKSGFEGTTASYIADWDQWILSLNNLAGTRTTKGAMMGDHSSFPIMPATSFYAMEQAGLKDAWVCGDDAEVPMGHTNRYAPRALSHPSDRTPRMASLLRKLKRRGLWSEVDGIAGRHAEIRRLIYDCAIEDVGGKLSKGDPEKGKPNKIFFHPTRGMFCEQATVRGRKIPHVATSLLAAPPGGSKGTIDWFTQPAALQESLRTSGAKISRRMWRRLPYYGATIAAYSMGVPVREPAMLGGISHPLFPHRSPGFLPGGRGVQRQQAWLYALSQLKLADWATGTGLCPIPASSSALNRKLARKWVEEIVEMHKEAKNFSAPGEVLSPMDAPLSAQGMGPRGPLPTLRQAAEIASRGTSSYLLYVSSEESILKAPSILGVAKKFDSKLAKGLRDSRHRKPGIGALKKNGGLPWKFQYSSTRRDVNRKYKSTFLMAPNYHISAPTSVRKYGLEASSDRSISRPAWMWEWGRVTNSDPFLTFGM